MDTWLPLMASFALALGVTPRGEDASAEAATWERWRGPNRTGVAASARPPVTWSESSNIRWKRPIEGQGLSTPIVWRERVFLQTAVAATGEGEANPGEQRRRGRRIPAPSAPYHFKILAIDRATGATVWERTLRTEVPHEGNHPDGSLAAASPVTDGKHLYVYFGSRGLYCLTLDGETVWEKDLGDMSTRKGFGEGSSPALHGDTLVVNWDHEGDSFIVALDKATGSEKWRRSRNEVSSWSTPLVVEEGDLTQVIVSAAERVRGYELATGKTIWECGGLGLNCTPTPVAGNGMVFVMSGYRDPALMAIRYRGATGDLTGSSAVAWRIEKGTSYVPSPILYDDALYFVRKNSGILHCYDPATGKPHYDQKRLDKINGVYASLVGTSDRVYVVGRNGVTYVLERGPRFKVLAINELDDSFSASPALVGSDLFLRGLNNLYCLRAD